MTSKRLTVTITCDGLQSQRLAEDCDRLRSTSLTVQDLVTLMVVLGAGRGGESGEKGGASADYQPAFRGSAARPGFDHGGEGYGVAPSSSLGFA
ncbi:unnamed protein product [Dovyalis caffra]|uniref:Uncharacterized protein n=1 Tax=Dovyalis caffra TaxID=77055 RepID=A0AAV1RZU6_9ROSI|nr:unnamed protein product [Dovyalis caffra]